jgi:hypothetical protein
MAAAEAAAAAAAEAAKVAAAEATEGFEFVVGQSADEVRARELQRATANAEVISFDVDDDVDSPSLPKTKRMRLLKPLPLRAPSGAPRAASDGVSSNIASSRAVETCCLKRVV